MQRRDDHCSAYADTGRPIQIPAGQLDAASPPVPSILLANLSEEFDRGANIFSASIVAQDGSSIPGPVTWLFDTLHASPQGALTQATIMERRIYVGASIIDVPISIPTRISLCPMDGALGFSAMASWKYIEQGSLTAGLAKEVSTRRLTPIVGNGFAPVDPAVGNDLLYPIGSELLPGLTHMDVSGFGWRPTTLTVRKTDANDDITLYIATGGLVGATCEFGVVRLDPGVSEWTGTVDPSWSGGLIIGNNIGNATHRILLIWTKP